MEIWANKVYVVQLDLMVWMEDQANKVHLDCRVNLDPLDPKEITVIWALRV